MKTRLKKEEREIGRETLRYRLKKEERELVGENTGKRL